jgi:four helix bundle protein
LVVSVQNLRRRVDVERRVQLPGVMLQPTQFLRLTENPAFEQDPELRRQLRSSSGRIQSHLQEGSGQGTDRHFAHYVGIARGSSKEVKGHLRKAFGCQFITEEEYRLHWDRYDEIAAMLTGLKNFLDRQESSR